MSHSSVMSPPGESSGGHQNIFRFLSYLEAAGHTVKIFLYWSQAIPVDADRVREMVERSSNYPSLKATYALYDPTVGVGDDVDAIFATGWETAYPAYLDRSNARRFYFVQDFEPSFYPVGSENQLAENTYRFGFEAFTAGKWLATKLHDEYGMTTHPFDFAAEMTLYKRTNDSRRKDVFFYARPVTMRRGFELGCMSCGTIPVVNDAPNNRLVSDNPAIDYVPLSPGAMAGEIIRIVDAQDQVERSREAAASATTLSWEDSGRTFVADFEEAMNA